MPIFSPATLITRTFGDGAPSGTGTEGHEYWDRTNDRLYLSDGVGWIILQEPAQSYTPTFTNCTVGNGTVAGTYHRSDGYCDFTARFALGSTSTVGQATVSLPVAAYTGQLEFETMPAMFYDATGARHDGLMYAAAAPGFMCKVASGTYLTLSVLSSTVPFTWATSDYMIVSGRYRMNTRYL